MFIIHKDIKELMAGWSSKTFGDDFTAVETS